VADHFLDVCDFFGSDGEILNVMDVGTDVEGKTGDVRSQSGDGTLSSADSRSFTTQSTAYQR
jgi:hypothetical protein